MRSMPQFIDNHMVRDKQPFGRATIDHPGLKRGQRPLLKQGVDPDRIERWQVSRQTADAPPRSPEIRRTAEVQLSKSPDKLLGGLAGRLAKFKHEAEILSQMAACSYGRRFLGSSCRRNCRYRQDGSLSTGIPS